MKLIGNLPGIINLPFFWGGFQRLHFILMLYLHIYRPFVVKFPLHAVLENLSTPVRSEIDFRKD